MTETGSFDTLLPNINVFSSTLSFGSSFGELYAWKKKGNSRVNLRGMTSEIQLEPIQLYLAA